jgi:hypothetical protein
MEQKSILRKALEEGAICQKVLLASLKLGHFCSKHLLRERLSTISMILFPSTIWKLCRVKSANLSEYFRIEIRFHFST